MQEFLLSKGVEMKLIHRISACILATSIPHHPSGILEEIICDADAYNLGNEEFLTTDVKVRMETEKRGINGVGSWDEKTLGFLKMHKFFTPYCQEKLAEGKARNIKEVEERIKKNQSLNMDLDN